MTGVALLAAMSSASSNESMRANELARIERAMTYIREFNQNAAFAGFSEADQASCGARSAKAWSQGTPWPANVRHPRSFPAASGLLWPPRCR
jgi:hypothetical protein